MYLLSFVAGLFVRAPEIQRCLVVPLMIVVGATLHRSVTALYSAALGCWLIYLVVSVTSLFHTGIWHERSHDRIHARWHAHKHARRI